LLKVTVTIVFGHAPPAALGGAAETAVGAAATRLGWSLHPVAEMISSVAANPIVRLLYLRMMVTLSELQN
jgi:hypothetical protein